MINPLKAIGNMGNLAKMQQQAQKMQQALQKEEVIVEKDGVRVVLRGDQQVREVSIDGVLDNRIADAINDAVRKTQELAAHKLLELAQQDEQ